MTATAKPPRPVDPARFAEVWTDVRTAVGNAVVGLDDVVEQVMVAVVAGGHCLLEGVPGVGKTLLCRSLASALGLPYGRIQFTPDLMPADVLGTDMLVERPGGGTSFEFRRGPVFASVLLADEINRATPKTQSALLEAMEERRVTVARHTHELPQPFFVLATQNPLEMEGTYALPEAQLDRFALLVRVGVPPLSELLEIVDRTTGATPSPVPCVTDAETVLGMQALVREVALAPHLREFVGRLVLATHASSASAPDLVRRVVRHGASPRAAVWLTLASKARALAKGRANVSEDDLRSLAPAVLRHRVLLNFEGEADGITPDDVAAEVLAACRAG